MVSKKRTLPCQYGRDKETYYRHTTLHCQIACRFASRRVIGRPRSSTRLEGGESFREAGIIACSVKDPCRSQRRFSSQPTNQPSPTNDFFQLYPPLGFEALAQSGQGRVHGYVWLFQTPRRAREAFPVGQLWIKPSNYSNAICRYSKFGI